MARYNAWQNNSLYGAADTLGDKARKQDRGAYFKSIHATLCHLLWGDQIWMHRFAGLPKPVAGSVPESTGMIAGWTELQEARRFMDREIETWAGSVSQEFLDSTMSWYSGSQRRDITNPTARLVVHMFNHQTHHRGQVHAMLTAAGAQPDDTDLFIMPEE